MSSAPPPIDTQHNNTSPSQMRRIFSYSMIPGASPLSAQPSTPLQPHFVPPSPSQDSLDENGGESSNACEYFEEEEFDDHDYNRNRPIKEVKVLILYTGGTIGMKKSPNGYIPVKGFLANQVAKLSQFHDPRFERKSPDDWFVTPVSPGVSDRRRARFIIKEYDILMDSSNMSSHDWNKIAQDISSNYDAFDAFIVLHGTDTLAYTTSALSFMLENLNKTVIVTGSQIPISRIRNDGFDNLLGSLTIATHYVIPEVTLFFDKVLLRGNRASKVDASGLHAFDSEKMTPLIRMAIDIEVQWPLIRRLPPPTKQFKVRMIDSNRNVGCLRLFPGISDTIMESFLKPPMEGCVLLTYGAGNAPDNRPEFLKILRDASNRGVVIVNVTQCNRGRVVSAYATGIKLIESGVIPGSDMTAEAALTKLMYLLSCTELSKKDVKRLIQTDMRGELTALNPNQSKFSITERTFLQSVAKSITTNPTPDDITAVQKALYPVLLNSFASIGDVDEMQYLVDRGVDVNQLDYDKRSPLHIAAAEGHLPVVDFLVSRGANANVRDRWGRTPLDEAIRLGNTAVIDALVEFGAERGQDANAGIQQLVDAELQ